MLSNAHSYILGKTSLRGTKPHTPAVKTPYQQTTAYRTTVCTLLYIGSHFIFTTQTNPQPYIFSLSNSFTFHCLFLYLFWGFSYILSYRNSRNQAAFVQQFLSNLHLPLPSPCFSPLVSTCLEIKEFSAGRRTSAQSDRDREPEVKCNSIKSATVDKSASSNSARGLYFCKRYAELQFSSIQSLNPRSSDFIKRFGNGTLH